MPHSHPIMAGRVPPSEADVLAEVRASSDLQLHFYCSRYAAIRDLQLELASAVLLSGKAAALKSLLPQLRAEGHRVVIFSQWTMTLDVLELLLEQIGAPRHTPHAAYCALLAPSLPRGSHCCPFSLSLHAPSPSRLAAPTRRRGEVTDTPYPPTCSMRARASVHLRVFTLRLLLLPAS